MVNFIFNAALEAQALGANRVEVPLPIPNYEEVKQELYNRGFELTEQEDKQGRRYLEVLW